MCSGTSSVGSSTIPSGKRPISLIALVAYARSKAATRQTGAALTGRPAAARAAAAAARIVAGRCAYDAELACGACAARGWRRDRRCRASPLRSADTRARADGAPARPPRRRAPSRPGSSRRRAPARPRRRRAARLPSSTTSPSRCSTRPSSPARASSRGRLLVSRRELDARRVRRAGAHELDESEPTPPPISSTSAPASPPSLASSSMRRAEPRRPLRR